MFFRLGLCLMIRMFFGLFFCLCSRFSSEVELVR